MTDRRKGERVPLREPSVGTLRLREDVEITRMGRTEAIVVAAVPIPRGERLLLEIAGTEGSPSTFLVRAAWSRAVAGDGGLRRQVLLQFVRCEGDPPLHDEIEAPAKPSRPVVGGLVRRVPVRLTEVSVSGCSFDSPACVGEGSVGFIDVTGHARRHTEVVRIRRTYRTEGRLWPYTTGAQFLTFGPALPSSLRGVATIMAVGPHGLEPTAPPKSSAWPRLISEER